MKVKKILARRHAQVLMLAAAAGSAANAQGFDGTEFDTLGTNVNAYVGVGVTIVVGIVGFMVGSRIMKRIGGNT